MKFCLSICISITLFSQTALAVACRDFNTQAEAQKWHEQNPNISRLDRDKDGEACECLPGGSAYGNPKCELGRNIGSYEDPIEKMVTEYSYSNYPYSITSNPVQYSQNQLTSPFVEQLRQMQNTMTMGYDNSFAQKNAEQARINQANREINDRMTAAFAAMPEIIVYPTEPVIQNTSRTTPVQYELAASPRTSTYSTLQLYQPTALESQLTRLKETSSLGYSSEFKRKNEEQRRINEAQKNWSIR